MQTNSPAKLDAVRWPSYASDRIRFDTSHYRQFLSALFASPFRAHNGTARSQDEKRKCSHHGCRREISRQILVNSPRYMKAFESSQSHGVVTSASNHSDGKNWGFRGPVAVHANGKAIQMWEETAVITPPKSPGALPRAGV